MKNLIRGMLAVAALASAVSLSAQTADEIVGKRLAMLKELLPRATRIAVLAQVNQLPALAK